MSEFPCLIELMLHNHMSNVTFTSVDPKRLLKAISTWLARDSITHHRTALPLFELHRTQVQ